MPTSSSLSSPRASSSSLTHQGEEASSSRLSSAGAKNSLPASKPETQDYDADEQERGSRLEKSSQLDEEEREAQKFKKVSWQGLAAVMLVEGVALGTLSFPAAFATLGLVPGIIVTVGIGLIACVWYSQSFTSRGNLSTNGPLLQDVHRSRHRRSLSPLSNARLAHLRFSNANGRTDPARSGGRSIRHCAGPRRRKPCRDGRPCAHYYFGYEYLLSCLGWRFDGGSLLAGVAQDV